MVIPSPAPFYNFAVTPTADCIDAYWVAKQNGKKLMETHGEYHDIHMPKNTGIGFIAAVFSGLFGFAMIWHMNWLILVGLAGVMIGIVARTFHKSVDYYLKAHEIAQFEAKTSK